MLKEAINKLIKREDLNDFEAYQAMNEIMSGEASSTLISAFLVALRMKGERFQEVAGCAKAMKERSLKIKPKSQIVIDTCGTGGDGARTINISTISAVIVASCGFSVAKHGNRSISSQCGSADVLESLGVKIDADPPIVEKCINEINIGFMFAPKFHPAMKNAMPVRKELGIRTIFNILGPLTNPADANIQILGVFDQNLTELIANALNLLGTKSAWVLNGDGIDEIVPHTKTKVTELFNGKINTFYIQPEDFGIQKITADIMQGGDIDYNKKIFMDVIEGIDIPQLKVVLMNAASCILLINKTTGGNIKTLKDAYNFVYEVVKSAKAKDKLSELVKFSNG